MRKHHPFHLKQLPRSLQTVLGLTTGLSLALLLKACGPLAPSIDKSRPSIEWNGSGNSAPGSSTSGPYRATFFRDQAPQITIPGLSQYRHVALASEAVESLRHHARVDLLAQPSVSPLGVIALFKLDLSDSEILQLGIEDLETTLTQNGAQWTLEVPRRNAAQQALWDQVRAHVMSLHLAVIFATDAPAFSLEWTGPSNLISTPVTEPSTTPPSVPSPVPSASPSPTPSPSSSR